MSGELANFHGFDTVLPSVRAVMTFRSSKVMEMKGMDIPELGENFRKKISTENIFPSLIFFCNPSTWAEVDEFPL